MDILQFVFYHAWATVAQTMTGKYQMSGGHMAGFGHAVWIGASYVAVLAQMLVVVLAIGAAIAYL